MTSDNSVTSNQPTTKHIDPLGMTMPLHLKSHSAVAGRATSSHQHGSNSATNKKAVTGISRSTPLAELPQIMTEAEIAAYLDQTLKQATRMRYEKQGPKMFKLCRRWCARREDIIAWIDMQASH